MIQVNNEIYILKFMQSELQFFTILFISITFVQHAEIFTTAIVIHCLC